VRAAALLLALLPAAAQAKKPAPPDAAALEAFARALYVEHFDHMDMDVPVDAERLVMFVADEAGAPVVVRGPEGLAAMKARFAAWKADGWAMTSTLSDLACRPVDGLGVCTALVAQHARQGDVDQGTLALRATIVADVVDGRWALLHLHESPAAPPAP
jgi:hypothetical protein